MADLKAVEICAGAGGQALGLELAGFDHALAVELDKNAVATLKENRAGWDVRCGDVADEEIWKPEEFKGVDLLAGGVPCPPFSIAGKQLGATDERDLFAWAVELAGRMQPRALMLENVRGLSMPRFAAYRQHVKDRLRDLGYWSDWRLLHANHFGVPQLRPRFVLVAMRSEEAQWFSFPEGTPTTETVGSTLADLMAAGDWRGAEAWAKGADDIAPTIVGGSKKHGGADLGPTRAKRAWLQLGVDGMGIADAPPTVDRPENFIPKLTTDMVKRLQGWGSSPEYEWKFVGRKTSVYRQVGNAFPPPVARAVGTAIADALNRRGGKRDLREVENEVLHDGLYLALKVAKNFETEADLIKLSGENIDSQTFERRMAALSRDFVIHERDTLLGREYRLGGFKGFTGQQDHDRHARFAEMRSRIS
ncbi:DNA (cytosine-5-)-methyltransferase [Streptomyces sp. MUM 136J]|uniref:DNA cytosine methyltransferase n=1 Tax=Streptomyces sp. MUM 136J TaxID=2791992 RepID=UPI001F041C83|nr:DNA (cytosine-5-)-methyltransferase [Streptomyces sp. MUM 136J]MCH0570929.1 DNA (cytosine-5-)-methyltransferase [Streptomyces sp. MUM 136J]